MVMGLGENIKDALGETGEASLRSSNPGDGRSSEIAKGLTDKGLSVHMQAQIGLRGGFNAAGVGLNVQQEAARPAGWQPDTAPNAPDTADMTAKTALDFS